MCFGGGGGGGPDPAAEQRRQEEERQQRIQQGRQQLDRIFGQLDPVAERQQQAFLDFANPQLQDQFGDARQDLAFALARGGQSTGSLAAERQADLERDFQLQQQNIADQALGTAGETRENIANQRQSLLNMLNATADPGQVAGQARLAVTNLSQTPSFSPLGPLFQNATGGLAGAIQGFQQNKQQRRIDDILNTDPDQGTGRIIR